MCVCVFVCHSSMFALEVEEDSQNRYANILSVPGGWGKFKVSLMKKSSSGGAGEGSPDINLPVGVPLMLDDQVLLVDGLKQSRGQGLEVGYGLRRGWQAAVLLLQKHLLD